MLITDGNSFALLYARTGPTSLLRGERLDAILNPPRGGQMRSGDLIPLNMGTLALNNQQKRALVHRVHWLRRTI